MSDYNNTTPTESTSREASVEYKRGGAISVSFGQDNSAPGIPEVDSLNANTGSGRLKVNLDGSQSFESLGVSRVNVGQDQLDQRANAASILDTARTAWGSRPSQLTKDCIVMVHGTETSLGAAVQMGLVRQDAQGNFIEVRTHGETNAGQPRGAQPLPVDAPQEQQGEQHGEYLELPPSTLTVLNEAIADVPQHIYEGTIHKVLNFGADSVDYRALADHLGTDEVDARARVNFVSQVYEVHAAQAIKGTVADPQEALAWLQENKPKEMARAMTKLVFGNQTSELKALAKTFERSTNPEDASLKAAGFETRTERDGTRMVRIQGQWMTVRSAVHAGWL